MQTLITGASGFIGAALTSSLQAKGHQVFHLVRRTPAKEADEIFWDPASGEIDKTSLEGYDAVVHLAGDNLSHGRWTTRKKALIFRSRVDGTHLLAQALASLKKPPAVLISASAIGAYGNRGDEHLTEDSPRGTGFLAEVCLAWEEAAAPAAETSIRVVHPRFGMVLGMGGALKKMLPPFRLGLGGRFGSGHQYLSWISLEDALAGIQHLIAQDSLHGPVNMVAPEPVTNREFTRILGQVLHRPTLFPVPAAVARLVLGEMADEMLLSSARVLPDRLLATGFTFRYPQVEGTLQHALGKS